MIFWFFAQMGLEQNILKCFARVAVSIIIMVFFLVCWGKFPVNFALVNGAELIALVREVTLQNADLAEILSWEY